MKTYTVFVVQCYKEKIGDQLTDFIQCELIAKNYEEAEKKAKKLVTRNNYRLSSVIEKIYDNT